MGLRNLLKDSIKHVHCEVEEIQIMKDYASGKISLPKYESLLHKLHEFWSKSSPDLDRLPTPFADFHSAYLKTISLDCEVSPKVYPDKKLFNEFSFFYILLGSAMGASVIIKNYVGTSKSHQHLIYLSQKARPLWTHIIKELESNEDSENIKSDCLRLFNDLKTELKNGEVAVEA